MRECVCGYTCGSDNAWTLHANLCSHARQSLQDNPIPVASAKTGLRRQASSSSLVDAHLHRGSVSTQHSSPPTTYRSSAPEGSTNSSEQLRNPQDHNVQQHDTTVDTPSSAAGTPSALHDEVQQPIDVDDQLDDDFADELKAWLRGAHESLTKMLSLTTLDSWANASNGEPQGALAGAPQHSKAAKQVPQLLYHHSTRNCCLCCTWRAAVGMQPAW